MKIFISYRRSDSKYVVDRIRDRLISAYGKEQVFRDIESIPLGQDFTEVLDRETKGCTVMLVVIGPQWLNITDAQGNRRLFETGDFTRIEVETGLNRKEILVIPVLVKDATMPSSQELPPTLESLSRRNAINIRNDPDFENDIQRLILGINQSQNDSVSPVSTKFFEPETIYIPQGKFWMGSELENGIPVHETPQHEVFLPAYRIGKYPVTNAEYQEFISQTKMSVPPMMGWDGQSFPSGKEKHPVTGVTWHEALVYCKWLSEETGRNYSIPNEAQWEKACRGKDKRLYPWGDEFDDERCNHGRAGVAPVDAYPAQSLYDCFDLVGNVRQWTCSLWGDKRVNPDPRYAYPWNDDGRNDLNANHRIRRVVRGSTMKDSVSRHRCSARNGQAPDDRGLLGARIGFRVMMSVG